MVDQHVEIGQIVIDSAEPHVGAGRAPIDHEQPINAGAAQRGNETVPGGEVGDSAAMQRQRCAQQGGDAAVDDSKIMEPDALQFEHRLAWRGSLRLLRRVAAGIESQEPGRDRRCGFAGRRHGKRRPEKRRVGELTSNMPMHLL